MPIKVVYASELNIEILGVEFYRILLENITKIAEWDSSVHLS